MYSVVKVRMLLYTVFVDGFIPVYEHNIKENTHSRLPLLPIHSLYHPPHSHHSGTSPPGVWPLEGDQHQLPTSVGYDHPEDWVGHGQYRIQSTTGNMLFCIQYNPNHHS